MWITDHTTKPCHSPGFDGGQRWSVGRAGQSSDGQPIHPYLAAAALRVLAVPSRLLFVAAATVAFSTFFLRAATVGAAFFVEAFVDAFAAVPAPRLALVLFLSAGATYRPAHSQCRLVGESMSGHGCNG